MNKHAKNHDEQVRGGQVWMLPSQGWTLRLPDGFHLTRCLLRRIAGDLVVHDPAHGRAILRRFYEVEAPPDLRDASENLLAGELARLVAGLPPDAMGSFLKRRFAG